MLTFLPSGRSLLLGFTILAVAGTAYAAARTTSLFAVERIEVRGAPPALGREVRRALEPLMGTSLVAVDGEELVARVEAIPEVRSAVYDRAFPHTLVVAVTRERPIAVLRRGRESWAVSTRGRLVRAVPRGANPRLPRIWVRKSVPGGAGAIVSDREARRALRAVAPLADRPLPVRVGTVRTGPKELTFELASGLELRLGNETSLLLKLAVAAEILRDLPSPAQGGPGYLDLSVPERPVAGSLNSQVELDG